jgi:hypothetical protein
MVISLRQLGHLIVKTRYFPSRTYERFGFVKGNPLI